MAAKGEAPGSPGRRRGGGRALLILNPAARGCRHTDPEELRRAVESAGLDVELEPSRRPDESARTARERGFERVIAAGGDGTLRSVASATDLPVAILPLGTSNSVARSVGISLRVGEAIHVAAHGEARPVDMGVLEGPNVPGGRLEFLLCASAGADAEVVRRYEGTRAGHSSFLRYAAVATSTAAIYESMPIDVTSDGRPTAMGVKEVIVSNMRVYGGWFVYTPDADPADGLLDVAAVRAYGVVGLTSALARAYFGGAQRPSRTLLFRTRSMRWEGDPRVPVSADGEPAGHLPVDITVRPGAVRLVLPGCA